MQKCIKHPKYKPKRGTPPNECLDCLSVYILLLTPRFPILQTKTKPSKKIYDRKKAPRENMEVIKKVYNQVDIASFKTVNYYVSCGVRLELDNFMQDVYLGSVIWRQIHEDCRGSR